MNVLYVLPVGERGGAERIVESWVAGHTRRVTPFVVMPEGPLLSSFNGMGVRAFAPDNFRMSNIWESVKFLKQLICKEKINLIHSSMPKGHLFGGLAAHISRTKEIWFNHGPVSKDYYQGIIPLIPTDRLLVNSEYMYGMQAATLYNARSLRIQRLGIDTKLIYPMVSQRRILREKHNISDDIFVVGVFGRLIRLKGQDLFLKAFAKLKKMNPSKRIVCIFVGGTLFGLESDYSTQLNSLIKSLDLSNDVILIDHTDDVYGYYDFVDVIVNPSIEPETFGLVVAEGMAKEKVVVASNAGGPRELIQHGVSGFLFEPGNDDELASLLLKITRLDFQSRSLIGRTARCFIENNYELSKSIESLENSYEEVLSE